MYLAFLHLETTHKGSHLLKVYTFYEEGDERKVYLIPAVCDKTHSISLTPGRSGDHSAP